MHDEVLDDWRLLFSPGLATGAESASEASDSSELPNIDRGLRI